MIGDGIELPVIRLTIDAPEAGTANISQSRTEAIAQQPKEAEHHIAVGAGIGHDVRRLQFGLLLQSDSQQPQTVAQGTWHRDRIQTSALVGSQVVLGDATPDAKILWIRGGMHGAHRHNKAHMPSADATSPPPHTRASAIQFWADTKLASAATNVSSRMKFCSTHVSRSRSSDWPTVCRRGTWPRTSMCRFRRCTAGFRPLRSLKSVHCSIAPQTPISTLDRY